jgi:hypothetical protein
LIHTVMIARPFVTAAFGVATVQKRLKATLKYIRTMTSNARETTLILLWLIDWFGITVHIRTAVCNDTGVCSARVSF